MLASHVKQSLYSDHAANRQRCPPAIEVCCQVTPVIFSLPLQHMWVHGTTSRTTFKGVGDMYFPEGDFTVLFTCKPDLSDLERKVKFKIAVHFDNNVKFSSPALRKQIAEQLKAFVEAHGVASGSDSTAWVIGIDGVKFVPTVTLTGEDVYMWPPSGYIEVELIKCRNRYEQVQLKAVGTLDRTACPKVVFKCPFIHAWQQVGNTCCECHLDPPAFSSGHPTCPFIKTPTTWSALDMQQMCLLLHCRWKVTRLCFIYCPSPRQYSGSVPSMC